MKKLFKNGMWRKFLTLLLIAIELAGIAFSFVALFAFNFDNEAVVFTIILVAYWVLTAFCVIYIFFTQSEPDYKITWMMCAAALPIVGFMLYLLFGNKRIKLRRKREMARNLEAYHLDATNLDLRERLAKAYPDANATSQYIESASGAGIYGNTEVKYYPVGDDAFPDMISALRKAKHYIFMEYFIVAPGYMWDMILRVLEQKVNEGVDVRFIYDDFGNLGTLPPKYYEVLREKGIKCFAFRPLKPLVDVRLNNRDHRKICVIDGHTGFTGGINLADEYINKIERFGHWKDNVIRLRGKAVYSLTLTFLGTWKSFYEKDFSIDAYHYSPETYVKEMDFLGHQSGYVQPYSQIPFDYASLGQNVYLSILARAKKYVYIMTPYLVLGSEMRNALRNAAMHGVDVRIITPHIPDKKTVFGLTRSNYRELLVAGVRIYEYTPGFIHSKTFLSDDEVATVGTINLDFRSLYLHMENGVYLIGGSAIPAMRKDFDETFAKSEEITKESYRKLLRRNRAKWAFLRLIAPLM